MEYKIFGTNGTPSDDIQNRLTKFVKLDEAQRRTIAETFREKEFDPYSRTIPPLVAASSLLPEQFREAVDLVAFLLFAWREYDLELADIERDLLLLGCSESEIETAIAFLKSVSEVKERVWAKNYLRHNQLDGLPTIDNLNVVCDARAVFGGFPEGAEHTRASYKTILSLEPIVILEIISSDNYGQRQRTAFQMTEKDLQWVRRLLTRAQEQLTILKERIGSDAKGA